jgi:hypothetical protein
MIYVTNNTQEPLNDGFGGVFYDFLPGKTVEVPEEVAKHIFGYNDPNKAPYLARLGWVKNSSEMQAGLERLAQWDLSTQLPKKNQSLSPLVERVPLPSQKKGGGKVLSVAA